MMEQHPVDKDSIGLVKRYAAKKSPSFEDFKSEWMECKFYLMHGIEGLSKTFVIERIFATMTDLLLDSNVDFFERLGSLYLCYSMYCTQLNSDSVKIRIELKDYAVLQSFHTLIREQKIHEADYVLCRLKSLSAFIICACQRKKCMGQQSDFGNSELTVNRRQSIIGRNSDLMQTLRQCQKLVQDYEQLKESISDHLPLNLVTKSNVIDEFLEEERIRNIEHGVSEAEPEPEPDQSEDNAGEDADRLLNKFRTAPKQIPKLA